MARAIALSDPAFSFLREVEVKKEFLDEFIKAVRLVSALVDCMMIPRLRQMSNLR